MLCICLDNPFIFKLSFNTEVCLTILSCFNADSVCLLIEKFNHFTFVFSWCIWTCVHMLRPLLTLVVCVMFLFSPKVSTISQLSHALWVCNIKFYGNKYQGQTWSRTPWMCSCKRMSAGCFCFLSKNPSCHLVRIKWCLKPFWRAWRVIFKSNFKYFNKLHWYVKVNTLPIA